ncbi:extracellular solute-binding protein [Actinobacteria bacterium YIM 96077]|uniref:Sugar ABC transporter substrate-binding protein n=1 Tax=Phytoactinopolyspora halophila TaxID=1981511 RepID=A0A329QNX5_9ACTN|nr:extracellular solute-binding protein [Phytoactinopolyspora halophila]AYY14583.1 extracellular solute-binding protein [Actinobacteria bacterium YIM 96077]RAW14040.1 sugar ABC transporter substrate-binding protein [Phytoactinopolyspora halophila]
MATQQPTRRQLLRWTGAGALAGVAGSFATSCGAGAPDDETTADAADSGGDDGTFTIYWNAGHAYEAYEEVIKEFEEEHGLTVNFQKYQWDDMRTRLLSDFAAGNVPDLVEDAGWAQEFAISGDALSLQPYIDEDGAEMGFPDDWQPTTIDRNSYEGEVYGIQLHLTCVLPFYNKAMFDAAGLEPPETWDDLLEVAKELTGDDVHGIALNQDASYAWSWMLQNGVRYYDPETEELMTPRDAAVEALQFQADLVHKHKVAPVPTPGTDYSGPQKLLSAERAAMILSGPWDLLPIRETSPDLELGIAPALRREKQAAVQAGTSVFIPAQASHPDLAWDLIKRLTALDVEEQATDEAGMLMPRVSWAESSAVQDNDQYSVFAKAFPYAVDYKEDLRLTGKSGEIDELFDTLYQDVVMNNTPADDALDAFLSEAEQVLAD